MSALIDIFHHFSQNNHFDAHKYLISEKKRKQNKFVNKQVLGYEHGSVTSRPFKKL